MRIQLQVRKLPEEDRKGYSGECGRDDQGSFSSFCLASFSSTLADPRFLASQVAEEKLSFVRIIAAYNAQELESKTFSKKVDTIFAIARREIWMEVRRVSSLLVSFPRLPSLTLLVLLPRRDS